MGSGSVYYYTRTGSYWSRQSKIISPSSSRFAYFGVSVSIYGDNALIGAVGDNDMGYDSGIYIECSEAFSNFY
jgi:hypothetical protein